MEVSTVKRRKLPNNEFELDLCNILILRVKLDPTNNTWEYKVYMSNHVERSIQARSGFRNSGEAEVCGLIEVQKTLAVMQNQIRDMLIDKRLVVQNMVHDEVEIKELNPTPKALNAPPTQAVSNSEEYPPNPPDCICEYVHKSCSYCPSKAPSLGAIKD